MAAWASFVRRREASPARASTSSRAGRLARSAASEATFALPRRRVLARFRRLASRGHDLRFERLAAGLRSVRMRVEESAATSAASSSAPAGPRSVVTETGCRPGRMARRRPTGLCPPCLVCRAAPRPDAAHRCLGRNRNRAQARRGPRVLRPRGQRAAGKFKAGAACRAWLGAFRAAALCN